MASRCVCEVLGNLELRAAVFCCSFAFPKAGKELNSKNGWLTFPRGVGLGPRAGFPLLVGPGPAQPMMNLTLMTL